MHLHSRTHGTRTPATDFHCGGHDIDGLFDKNGCVLLRPDAIDVYMILGCGIRDLD
jgi:hypothetical protein